jgi:hypothetical protein
VTQLVALALTLGAGAYAGYRWCTRSAQAHEVTAELLAQDELCRNPAGRPERNLGALEYDPASGVYRPVRRS